MQIFKNRRSKRFKVCNQNETLRIVIVDQCDPTKLQSGGIDTCIAGQMQYAANDVEFKVIGVTSQPELVGIWQELSIMGRDVCFLPVACIDKDSPTRWVGKLPHSLILTAGILRYHKKLPVGSYQAHRVEIGFILSFMQSNYHQFVHNDQRNLTGKNSDSIWKWAGIIYRKLQLRVARTARTISVFNQAATIELRESRPDTIRAFTWFDPEMFKPSNRKFANDVIREHVEMVWVGRFDSQKDPSLALETFKSACNQGIDVRMTMIGSGALHESVMRDAEHSRIDQKIIFTGNVSRKEISTILQQSDLLLMTSHYEGSPTVLVEALACGVPVLCTHESDPDLLIDGLNGTRMTSRAPEILASQIKFAADYDRAHCADTVAHRSGPDYVPILITKALDKRADQVLQGNQDAC